VEAYGWFKLAHIVVWGYWVGSDLVVNQLTHYLTHAEKMEGMERNRLWNFLLDVDQHPRNALILSLPLGLTLGGLLGLVPLGTPGLVSVWIVSGAWFSFMWYVHLRGHTAAGAALRAWDVRIRYGVIAVSVGVGGWSLVFGTPIAAGWLAAKVVLFGLVVGAGIGIRYYIQALLLTWPDIVQHGSTPIREAAIRQAMRRGTWVLAGLHLSLLAAAFLGHVRPF